MHARSACADRASPSPCLEPSLGPTGTRVAGGARLGISAHRFCPGLRGTWSRFPSAGLDGWDARRHPGLPRGFSQGRLQCVLGEAVLPLLCGPVWPLALRELAASPDKEPRALGCPRSRRVGLLPLGSHGIASLLADSEARPVTVPVAPAAWDSQG